MFSASAARAHWFSTTYSLKGGWNAIYLHGAATHAPPDTLFPNSGATAGVLEIWRWNPRPNQVQFTASPLIPSAGAPEWSVWKRGLPLESNLTDMNGQTAYLVRCSGTIATAHNVPIVQRALPPSTTWVRSGANLLGFPTKLTSPNYPSFGSYFAAFTAATAANSKIYKYVGGDLGPANPLQLFSPTTEQLDRNRAYWFEAEVVGNFFAPIDISLSVDSGVDFGRTGSVITARVRNTTTANLTLNLAPLASLAAPAGQDAITGQVPLMRRTFNSTTATWTETPITGAYTEVIGASSTVELSFGINRAAMSGPSNALYAGLLQLTDSGNLFDISLPVSARVASMAGLWIGDASITNVSSQVQATATATAELTDGVLTGIKLNQGGLGYGTVPVPVIAPPAGVQAAATPVMVAPQTATGKAAKLGGRVLEVTVTGSGSGYTTAPAVTISAPGAGGTQAVAVATVADGKVTEINIVGEGGGYQSVDVMVTVAPPPAGNVVSSLTITNGGSGYPIAPVVTLSAPPAGMTATAVATVSGGVITGLSIVNTGSGYSGAPAVSIGSPPASGVQATAVAEVKGGQLTGITVTSAGSGYTAAPVITIAAPPERATASATATVENGKVTGFTISNGGGGYLAPPSINLPTPTPPGTATARAAPLRLLLHVEDAGTARLLSQVFLGKLSSGTSGICTRESSLSSADKASASRFVAAHLPLDRVLGSGSGSVALGQTLTRSVSIPFDDDTNPFVHRYHPDHDNKDARFRPLGAGVESYGITRTISLQFTTSPPPGESATGWGSSSIGGNYTEVIKGLHKQDLTVTGTFVLRRASENGALTIN